MNITYASNGNILSKTGVGEYTYNDQFKPHAVISVDNTDGLMSTARLNTTFNYLGKIQTIGDAGQYRNMDFVYGPDQQRWYSVMKKHGAVEREIVYAGDYEKVTDGGITREFYYLDGGAIIVKQNGEFKPYQAFTDNLGSILSVVDEKGEKVFEASYDAWGKQTKNLKFTNMLNLHRGYTGHEMLNEFGIINMNGRLYDPVLGRFFSPDNYVQAPNNSQNFNRYSYCLNNPLKYTDPSGEFFHLIIGAALGGIVNWMTNGCRWNAKGLGCFGVGALAGFLSAGVGAGVCSSLPVAGDTAGGFFAGFWGTSSASTATSCFLSGAAIAGSAGACEGLVLGFGNSLIERNSVNDALKQGIVQGITHGVTAGLIGGLVGGISADSKGRSFWDGAKVHEEVLIDQQNPLVGQRGRMNCVGSIVESATDGKISQEQIRAIEDAQRSRIVGRTIVSNPDEQELLDVNAFQNTAKELGLQYEPGTVDKVLNYMTTGDKVGFTYQVGSVDERHAVLMNKVTLKTRLSVKGKFSAKVIYQVMDPANGGRYVNFNLNKTRDVSVLRLVTPYNGPLL